MHPSPNPLLNDPYDRAMSPLETELAIDEGYRAHVYRCTAGKLTIGYGLNISAGLPQDEALVLLRYRLAKLDAALRAALPWYDGAGEHRQRALCNMAYQMGIEGLMGFQRMLAACAAGDWQGAADHALESKWARSDSPERARRVAAKLRDNR